MGYNASTDNCYPNTTILTKNAIDNGVLDKNVQSKGKNR